MWEMRSVDARGRAQFIDRQFRNYSVDSDDGGKMVPWLPAYVHVRKLETYSMVRIEGFQQLQIDQHDSMERRELAFL
jgi:hypothetical protein